MPKNKIHKEEQSSVSPDKTLDKSELKLKQQIKTNTFVFISIIILAIIIGLALAFLK